MKNYTFLVAMAAGLFICFAVSAQNVGIGTASPNTAAILDISAANKGLLIPRVNLTATNSNAPVGTWVPGLLVYNLENAGTAPNNVVANQFYYSNGSQWLAVGTGTGWGLAGNAGTSDDDNFIGTTDDRPFNIRVRNQRAGRIDSARANTFFGYRAGDANTTGSFNTASGVNALRNNSTGVGNTASGAGALFSNTTGFNNTASGVNALRFNTLGANNTASGRNALLFNTTGENNTASGVNALRANTTGFNNTASGVSALLSNTTGSGNTASGLDALFSNTTGIDNTATGASALRSNTTGESNTASGDSALYSNTTGNNNTASGVNALFSNTTGESNTASGVDALRNNTTGFNNTASGVNALMSNTTGSGNTASGVDALLSSTTGSDNTATGASALRSNTDGRGNTANGVNALFSNTTGDYNTACGVDALRNNTLSQGNTAIGNLALYSNTIGGSNTASGWFALYNNTTGFWNTAIGVTALISNTTGDYNTALGNGAGSGLNDKNFKYCTFIGANSSLFEARTNVTMLGYGVTNDQCTGNNQVLLGNTAITQIRAQVSSLTTYSDARFKVNVKDNIKGLDFIMRLNPVSYQQDPARLQQIWNPTGFMKASNPDYSEIRKKRFIGFLAQDVEKAAIASGFDFPGIDVPQTDTDVYTLRYVDFIMPMVKAMQEQQGQLQKQQQEIAELKRQNEAFYSELKQIRAMLEK